MENVVGRYIDGRLIKGTSVDVTLGKPTCHIQTPAGETVLVELSELKALFFVKDLEGNRGYRESQAVELADARRIGAKTMEIRFLDGETLVGLVTAYSPDRPFFFVLPADPLSNNSRILVNREAVEYVRPATSDRA